jgi:hypothetical protein
MNDIYSSTQPIQCTHAITLTVDTPLGVTEVQVEAHHNGSLIKQPGNCRRIASSGAPYTLGIDPATFRFVARRHRVPHYEVKNVNVSTSKHAANKGLRNKKPDI